MIFSDSAKKEFLNLGTPAQQQIKNFICRLQNLQDPRSTGRALTGSLSGLWRYRVGDYRLVCSIDNQNILITVLRVGHRSSVYKKKK